DNDYALYVDSRYMDGTSLYGQCARFSTGTHDWEYSSFVIRPEKPIEYCSVYVLFRRHTGEAWFDQLALRRYEEPSDVRAFPPDSPLLDVYPIPARDLLQVVLASPHHGMHRIALHDPLGRQCLAVEVEARQTLSLPVRGLVPGMYMLSVNGVPQRTVVVAR
ncbi:MAG: hypothetical protein KFF77_09875, partial [Bacteroidetes bacterium]|nr:hypothetical protein [Bacteroidota bacterium]